MAAWPEAERIDRLHGKVLMPGLIEAHSHLMEGAMWEAVPGLLRSARSRGPPVARPAHAGCRAGAPGRGRACPARCAGHAAGLGLRSHPLRQQPAVGARAGPCLRHAAHRHPARQRAPDECELGHAGAGRHRRGHRHRRHPQGRRGPAHRRAAGVRRHVPRSEGDRQRAVSGCRRAARGDLEVRPRGPARGRDHGHRPGQRSRPRAWPRCARSRATRPIRCASSRPSRRSATRKAVPRACMLQRRPRPATSCSSAPSSSSWTAPSRASPRACALPATRAGSPTACG